MRAGILEDRSGTADLVGEILRDPYLNEDQKRTLVRIYDSFRRENGNLDNRGPRSPVGIAAAGAGAGTGAAGQPGGS